MGTLFSELDYKKIKEIFETEKKKLLFFHRDGDGSCSAALVLKFFPDFKAYPLEAPEIKGSLLKKILQAKPNLIVFLDLPIDQEHQKILKIQKDLEETMILIVDHHIVTKDLNSERIFHINPKFKYDVYLPVSYLVYRILGKIGKNIRPYYWIAAAGVFSDYGFNECKSFLQQGGLGLEDLELVSHLIGSAITLRGKQGCREVLNILVNMEDFRDFKSNRKLLGYKEAVDTEIQEIKKRFESEREVFGPIKLIIFNLQSKLNITSIMATHFSEVYPDHVIVIAKRGKAFWKVSVRQQSGEVNVGNLVTKCAAGIGTGGGHKKAAGARIYDFGEFRERLIEALEKGK